jgi:hypothetical protein
MELSIQPAAAESRDQSPRHPAFAKPRRLG